LWSESKKGLLAKERIRGEQKAEKQAVKPRKKNITLKIQVNEDGYIAS